MLFFSYINIDIGFISVYIFINNIRFITIGYIYAFKVTVYLISKNKKNNHKLNLS
ncbi:MAG: hypothetical protein HeimC3_26830 [Candidatus Heimdallarchaeota archaeon LC_3]|nr:MAG: hypothetical protein HeimC3_26830 [Candidatus Heimdallarchaeota archaeon LC_3]